MPTVIVKRDELFKYIGQNFSKRIKKTNIKILIKK